MNEPNWNDRLSLPEKIERVQWLCLFPALTVMVLLRRNIGIRLFGGGAAVMLLLLFCLAQGTGDGISGPLFFVHACVFLFCGGRQCAKRWREFRRGGGVHSRYIGDSVFERWPWPNFMRRERRICRYVEPGITFALGLLLMSACPLFGMWIALCGLCLRLFEGVVYRREIERQMDMADSIIESDMHAETVSRLLNHADQAESPITSSSIATGNAADTRSASRRRTPPNCYEA